MAALAAAIMLAETGPLESPISPRWRRIDYYGVHFWDVNGGCG